MLKSIFYSYISRFSVYWSTWGVYITIVCYIIMEYFDASDHLNRHLCKGHHRPSEPFDSIIPFIIILFAITINKPPVPLLPLCPAVPLPTCNGNSWRISCTGYYMVVWFLPYQRLLFQHRPVPPSILPLVPVAPPQSAPTE